jgi:hypothetical protein
MQHLKKNRHHYWSVTVTEHFIYFTVRQQQWKFMLFIVVSLRDINKRIVIKNAWIHIASKTDLKNNQYVLVHYHSNFLAPANFLLKEKFDKNFDPSRWGLFFGPSNKQLFNQLKISFLSNLQYLCYKFIGKLPKPNSAFAYFPFESIEIEDEFCFRLLPNGNFQKTNLKFPGSHNTEKESEP